MEKNLNQPKTGDMILGGLEGVKRRLASDSVEQKIAALSEAVKYGQAGLDLVIQVLKDESSPIQSVAYLLLNKRAEQQVNEALQEYYSERIKDYEERIKIYGLPKDYVITFKHEFRTPLNSIIGFLRLILEGCADDPEEEREFLQEAHRSALHLLALLNDIIDIARIEAGHMELDLGPVKLDELFKDVEGSIGIKAQPKNLSFSLQMPTNHDEIILYANYQRLRQVMLNLVDNAIKFTPDSGITISAEVSNKKVGFAKEILPAMIRVEIADTRIGVPLEDQNELFQPFSTVSRNFMDRSDPGYVNLLLSKSLVELMGGTMSFYSQGWGLGSTVTFTVPLIQKLNICY